MDAIRWMLKLALNREQAGHNAENAKGGTRNFGATPGQGALAPQHRIGNGIGNGIGIDSDADADSDAGGQSGMIGSNQ